MPDFVVENRRRRQYTLKAEIRHVNAYTVGWEGFIEADLVGPAGSSLTRWTSRPSCGQTVVADKMAWLQTVATGHPRIHRQAPRQP
jgi:hypothetical protein